MVMTAAKALPKICAQRRAPAQDLRKRGEGEQTFVARGQGPAQHAHRQDQMLHERRGGRNSGIEKLAQDNLGARQQNHQNQRNDH